MSKRVSFFIVISEMPKVRGSQLDGRWGRLGVGVSWCRCCRCAGGWMDGSACVEFVGVVCFLRGVLFVTKI